MKKILPLISLFFCSITLTAQVVDIPDINFKTYLLSESSINTNGDNEIQVSEAKNFKGTLFCSSLGIENLKGIEHFTSIDGLQCNDNKLTSLDVSKNVALIELYFQNNLVTSINVSKNLELVNLIFDNNKISKIDVSKNQKLKYLSCSNNEITSLDLSKNIDEFARLECDENKLETLDLSNNKLLERLNCQNNLLYNLNIKNGNNNNIVYMYANNNDNLNCIQVDDRYYAENPKKDTNWRKNNTATYYEDCNGSHEILNIPDNKFKKYLVNNKDINKNQDTEIQVFEANIFDESIYMSGLGISDVTGIEAFIRVKSFSSLSNPIVSIDLSNSANLRYLNIYENDFLTNLNLSGTEVLVRVDILHNDKLKAIDLSSSKYLTNVLCSSNKTLTSLNIKNGNNTNIKTLQAHFNKNLTCIQVDDPITSKNNSSWEKDDQANYSTDCNVVYIPDNNFKYSLNNIGVNTNGDFFIQVSEAENFTKNMTLRSNGIKDLTGIEAFTNLTKFYSYNNTIENIDLSNNKKLTLVLCNGNGVKNLNLTENTLLEYLYCSDNEIAELDLSKNINLKEVHCKKNSLLKTLNIQNSNNENLTVLQAQNNAQLNCIKIDDENASRPSCDVSNNKGWCKDSSTLYSESCAAASIRNFSFENAVLVYPNPAKNSIEIINNSDKIIREISIFNAFGSEIVKSTFKSNIDISTLSSGIYFLSLKDAKGNTVFKKIIKE